MLSYSKMTTGSCGLILLASIVWSFMAVAQTPPSNIEIENYRGLIRAVTEHDMNALKQQLSSNVGIDQRDDHGRSALHVAAYFQNHAAMNALVAAGANANALEGDFYDIVTIAAVANDLETMKLGLKLGCRADNVTSRYDGTALIAAAHLGHVEIVQTLIRADAPLDHVNNLKWTALIESIVLGDSGRRHTATLGIAVASAAEHFRAAAR